MSNKKFDKNSVMQDTVGPMNSVSKEDARVWAEQTAGNVDEKQLNRIIQAKKKKARRATKKQDRRDSKQLMRNYEEDNNNE